MCALINVIEDSFWCTLINVIEEYFDEYVDQCCSGIVLSVR